MAFTCTREPKGPGRWVACLLVILAVYSLPTRPLRSETPPWKADSSLQSREQATRAIPWEKLPAEMQAAIADITRSPTIYRRMPVAVTLCDPDLYNLLVRYPEIVVNMWQLMNVTRVRLQRVDDQTFDAFDGAGTHSRIRLVYDTPDLRVFYGEGYYQGPLLGRRVDGRCVALLSSGYFRDEEGRPYVTTRLDIFLQLDPGAAQLLARTLHPLVGRTADSNFLQSARFVGQVSDVAHTNPDGMQQLIPRLENVSPPVRQKLAALVQRAAENPGTAEGGSAVAEALQSVRPQRANDAPAPESELRR